MHSQVGGAAASVWFRSIRRSPAPRRRLVCFPHAGGSASFYRSWGLLVPDDVDLLAVRYPGREDRFVEAPAERMEELVEPLAEACAELVGAPLVFFGHSMGASVAYEVAARMKGMTGAEPEALFVSGRSGPGRIRSRSLAAATDEELVADLTAMSATNARALADEELRALVLPLVRADYRLVERYRAAVPPPILDIPLVAYFGDRDENVDSDSVDAWSVATRSGFTARAFPGGHFYLEDQAEAVVTDLFARLG